MVWLTKKWKGLLGLFSLRPVLGMAAFFIGGNLFWGGFNWSLELTNTEQFCISCHEMREFVYKEYKTSAHYTNHSGVRASCPDCHVPKEWFYKVVRKIRATNELFQWMRGTIDTPEKFEAKRLQLAGNVWTSMKEADSRECRNCHDIDSMNRDRQTAKTWTTHQLARKWDKTCIDCHQGIAHSLPKGFNKEAQMDALHDRIEKEKVDCRSCHEGMAGPPPGEGWNYVFSPGI